MNQGVGHWHNRNAGLCQDIRDTVRLEPAVHGHMVGQLVGGEKLRKYFFFAVFASTDDMQVNIGALRHKGDEHGDELMEIELPEARVEHTHRRRAGGRWCVR